MSTEAVAAEALRLEGIHKAFGSFVALQSIDLSSPPGELVCFLGPSGCGKTTLLRIIAGLEQQTRGRVVQNGRDVSNAPPAARDYGIVFQSYALFPNLTITDNVAYGLVNRRKSRAEIEARVRELLTLVGLPDAGAEVSEPDVGRPAAARRARARAGDGALAAAARRAAVGAGREGARAAARRDPPAAAAPQSHDDHGHARPGRGAVDGRPRRRHEPGPDRAGRHRRSDVYERPATPFVADFLGKVNVLKGVALGGGRYRVGATRTRACRSNGSPRGAASAHLPATRGPPCRRRSSRRCPTAARTVAPHRLSSARSAWPSSTVDALGPADARFVLAQPAARARRARRRRGRSRLRGDRVRVFAQERSQLMARPGPVRTRRPCLRRTRGAPSRLALAAESLAARGGLAAAGGCAARLPDGAARDDPRAQRRGQVGRVRRTRQFRCVRRSRRRSHSSTWNTLTFACLTTLVTVPLAFVFAYAIQRSCIPFKGLWRNIALIPILAPSMLAAISFIYLFGNQGALKFVLGWFGLTTIYGLPGMVLAMTFSAFPHAVMILLAALALVRRAPVRGRRFARHVSEWRKFMTITLPGAKYGLISASDGRVHDGGVRVRRAESHRRQLRACWRSTSTSR